MFILSFLPRIPQFGPNLTTVGPTCASTNVLNQLFQNLCDIMERKQTFFKSHKLTRRTNILQLHIPLRRITYVPLRNSICTIHGRFAARCSPYRINKSNTNNSTTLQLLITSFVEISSKSPRINTKSTLILQNFNHGLRSSYSDFLITF